MLTSFLFVINPSVQAPITPKTPKKDEGEGVIKKKNKKKKKRLPKNYNPNVDPDPERWLPRSLSYTNPSDKNDFFNHPFRRVYDCLG